ncbi:unnamed protein product [marine sediment metagenome]|uniref:Uncharacterized protein n=1 Tax=marine sediment metagenome TaxID=412755 RepID=X0SFI3_9ZZZZ
MIFIVEFQHKHGSELWAAATESLAELLIRTVQAHIFKERGEEGWWLKDAQEDWTGYSGGTEFFNITEAPLMDTAEAAKRARA